MPAGQGYKHTEHENRFLPRDVEIPCSWKQIRTVDMHTAGEPLRIVLDGFPDLGGGSVLELRRCAKERFDRWRMRLMWEPRGHADMYGCLILPPAEKDGDFSVLFMHNAGWSTMCGHGIIAVSIAALSTGLVDMDRATGGLHIDTPAGRVVAYATVDSDGGGTARFLNVPSFAAALDQSIVVPGLGRVAYDLAFGGAFYAYVDAASIGLTCDPAHVGRLVVAGKAIKEAIVRERTIEHPAEDDLGFLYGTIFTAEAGNVQHHSRHVCIFADGEVDRSPTGTGVSGRLAILHSRGELGAGQPCVIESILGTTFTGRIASETTCGPHQAVVPEVTGTAHITGVHTFVFDPHDPLADGFLLA